MALFEKSTNDTTTQTEVVVTSNKKDNMKRNVKKINSDLKNLQLKG